MKMVLEFKYDQEELFYEKTQLQNSPATVPLSNFQNFHKSKFVTGKNMKMIEKFIWYGRYLGR